MAVKAAVWNAMLLAGSVACGGRTSSDRPREASTLDASFIDAPVDASLLDATSVQDGAEAGCVALGRSLEAGGGSCQVLVDGTICGFPAPDPAACDAAGCGRDVGNSCYSFCAFDESVVTCRWPPPDMPAESCRAVGVAAQGPGFTQSFCCRGLCP